MCDNAVSQIDRCMSEVNVNNKYDIESVAEGERELYLDKKMNDGNNAQDFVGFHIIGA